MKVAIFNVLGAGHVNPTLSTVRALVSRGDEVVYYCYPQRRAGIEAAGAQFRNYGRDDFRVADYHPQGSFPTQILPAAAGLMPYLVDDVGKQNPDFVLTDVSAAWGIAVGQALGLPVLGSCSSPVPSRLQLQQMFTSGGWLVDDANRQAVETLRNRWNVDLDLGALGMQFAPVNVAYTTAAFNPPIADRTERFEFVGPLVDSRPTEGECDIAALRQSGKRIVYISMGSILGRLLGLDQAFYQPLFDALAARSDVQGVVALGRDVDMDAFDPPDNLVLYQFVPQLELLPNVDAMITHGGMNSVCEALFHGVPMIVMPHHGDQPIISQLVVQRGAGLELPFSGLDATRAAETLGRVLDEPSFGAAAQEVGASFRTAGGVARVLEVIDEMANTQ